MDNRFDKGIKTAKISRFRLTLLLFILLSPFWSFSQGEKEYSRNTYPSREYYFKFVIDYPSQIADYGNKIAVDQIKGDTVWAYANAMQFAALQIETELLVPPSRRFIPKMKNDILPGKFNEWDFYPTFGAYEALMMDFQAQYPDLCRLQSIGKSEQGRDIWMLHISDDPGQMEPEPGFLYTATMHGDETVGYVLLLQLIDYLLSNYNIDPQVTALVDDLDIYINPLANPDGTYAMGNHTVFGATRANANGVDLNRNFPDPKDGNHPDGNEWQAETVAFMNFAQENPMTMSANLHTGTEVVNYPWDTWSRLHADNNWWYFVSRQYADTVHAYSTPGYLTDLNNGITNGYDWYSINGGRQDYMNYFHHCREFTLELSSEKLPPADELPNYWEWNYRSLLNYMEQCRFGIHGFVSDSLSDQALYAEIFIPGHDKDSSRVFTDGVFGAFYRPLFEGTYDIEVKARGYHSKTIQDVSIAPGEMKLVEVMLSEDEEYGLPELPSYLTVTNRNNKGFIEIHSQNHPIRKITIHSLSGRTILNRILNTTALSLDLQHCGSGIYICTLQIEGQGRFATKLLITD